MKAFNKSKKKKHSTKLKWKFAPMLKMKHYRERQGFPICDGFKSGWCPTMRFAKGSMSYDGIKKVSIAQKKYTGPYIMLHDGWKEKEIREREKRESLNKFMRGNL